MKEKGKKVLKTLGVGALALVGGLTFAGCSVDLTDEQMDKIMYTVENSDIFMKETIDLLNKQNAQLDKQEAHNLCKMAYEKINLNYQGMRDNLTIKMYQGEEVIDTALFQTMISYSIDNEDVIISQMAGETTVLYEDNNEAFLYNKQGLAVTKEKLDTNIHYSNNWYGINIILQLGLGLDDIVSCEILENNNYKITYALTNLDMESEIMHDVIVEVEITKTGEYVKLKSYSAYTNFADASRSESVGIITYEYGNVNTSIVNPLLSEAKAASETPAE